VLRRRGIVTKNGNGYALTQDGLELSAEERKTLIALCDEAIAKYKEKRGRAIAV
jgi:hypothetical protein